jgi:hypothetical protein
VQPPESGRVVAVSQIGAPFEFQQPFLRRSRALLITAPLGQRASRVCWKENRGTVTERS